MTIDEAKSICSELTKINIDIWKAFSSSEKERLRQTFKSKFKSVIDAGFKIRRWRQLGNPMFTPRIVKHTDMMCIATNKPDDLNVKGDCTTRCISFCTGIDYMKIREEQMSIAQASPSWLTWKHDAVWGKCLTARGFTKLCLDRRHVSRATFIKLAKTLPVFTGKIAAVSSDHVAAIDMASRKILDTWNSSGGRILYIYVPISQKDVYYRWLKQIGCCL